MFKLCYFAAILAVACAAPAPEAKANSKADPSLLAYSSPLVTASPAVAYTSAFSAPLAYASYVSPSYYTAGYPAYSPYTASYIVV